MIPQDDLLGTGGYATVRRRVKNGVPFARKQAHATDEALAAIIREHEQLKTLNHPSIITLLVLFYYIYNIDFDLVIYVILYKYIAFFVLFNAESRSTSTDKRPPLHRSAVDERHALPTHRTCRSQRRFDDARLHRKFDARNAERARASRGEKCHSPRHKAREHPHRRE